ncbi:MAG: MerR family transcriptional regulator [Blautia sp.]|nr:MerR family transcriptional regulator [Blautia sp.]
MDMTLREVCAECEVTRRAVQGYEQHGLVTPSGRTPSGYLLYDEDCRKRIQEIKRWQDIGFALKEIKEFIDAVPETRNKVLELQIYKLQEQQERITELIQLAKELMR